MKIITDLVSLIVRTGDAYSERCLPEWHFRSETCPYGKESGFGPGRFTWPHPADVNCLDYVAAFYSLMPVFMGLFFPLLFLWTRGTRELLAVVFFWLELPVMLVLKAIEAQKRPEGSCLVSCGMPSGHAMDAMGFFFWIALEIILVRSLSIRQKSLWLAASGILLLPVGWSRTVLLDHSWPQVIVGGAVGMLCAGLWYLFLRLRLVVWALKLLCAHLRFIEANFPPDFQEEAPWAVGPGYGTERGLSRFDGGGPLQEGERGEKAS